MPRPKDITNDLARLHRKPLIRSPEKKPTPIPPSLRPMAFDPVLWVTLLLMIGTVVCQLSLLFWQW